MPFRYRPFGIPEQHLRQELRRRQREYEQALTPRRNQLAELRQAVADLTQYRDLLLAEARQLEAEQRDLTRELAEGPAPGDPITLETLQQTLRHYQALRQDLSASVLSLIIPFLAKKEETTWRSDPRQSGSGSGGP